MIILCTTPSPADDTLVTRARENSLDVFRGSADDVVLRMAHAAREFGIDIAVSIGGDDVFSDPECADLIIERLQQTDAEFADFDAMPVGASPYGVTRAALEKLLRIRTGGSDGWERYFQEGSDFRAERMTPQNPVLRRPELRMTLDYPEDFEFFRNVIETLYPANPRFSLGDVIRLIDERADIRALSQIRADEWQLKWTEFDVSVQSNRNSGQNDSVQDSLDTIK